MTSLSAALAHGDFPVDARDRKLLLAHAAGVAPSRLMMLDASDFTADLLDRYAALLARRAAYEPVSKIIGRRAFWEHEFRVTPDVLDPRPDTEVLVAEAVSQPFTNILDLGTGSGCILISCLLAMPSAQGVGVDLSDAALAVAQDNAIQLGADKRARFIASDWFANVTGTFDLIVSNPPYIAADEMPHLSRDVLDWDPHLALTPGGDGLEPYRIIARHAPAHMTGNARLLVEIGPSQGQAVSAMFSRNGLSGVRILQDFDGRDRVVTGVKPAV